MNIYKKLREAVVLSQEEMANILGVTVRSITRYESGETVGIHSLKRYKDAFQVSMELLLDNMGMYQEKKSILKYIGSPIFKDRFYAYNYEKIDPNKSYYLIWEIDTGKTIEYGAQTIWKRDCRGGEAEKRVPREKKNPNREYWERIYGKLMIINTFDEVCAFMLFGGVALIEKELCEKYLPEFWEPGIIVDKEELQYV